VIEQSDSNEDAARQAGADVIEITKEMIEAGTEVLDYWDSDLMGDEFDRELERTLTEIYRAMWKTSRRGVGH
jgi:hypothetical protein